VTLALLVLLAVLLKLMTTSLVAHQRMKCLLRCPHVIVMLPRRGAVLTSSKQKRRLISDAVEFR